jgi:hypothetical protein
MPALELQRAAARIEVAAQVRAAVPEVEPEAPAVEAMDMPPVVVNMRAPARLVRVRPALQRIVVEAPLRLPLLSSSSS